MTTSNHYNVKNDILYQNFIFSKPNLSDASIKRYYDILNKFCRGVNNTLTNIVNECKEQQDKIIERTINRSTNDNEEIVEKIITKYDVNDPNSKLKKYLEDYIDYCKTQGNKNITINHNLDIIKSFLLHYNLELPRMQRLPDDSSKWYLLSKEDLNYIVSDSSLVHSSLITFLISTGMRIHDATSLTIGDFMEATKDYHNSVDVDDFIDNAPEDMMGYWQFNPHKTKRFNHIECQTFNSPESSNLILQNLRKIKTEYIPYAKKKYGVELTMSKNDALFGSQKANFKGPIPPKAIGNRFWLKNKKLREWRIGKIDMAIKKGELSVEDRDNEISKIPKFHAHACRKYFETMISRNCGDLRICTVLEGHVSPVATDSSYIKKDFDEIKEAYMAALDDLTLEKTETKVYTSEVRREMESKIESLERENESLKQKNESAVNALWKELDDMKARQNAWEEIKRGE